MTEDEKRLLDYGEMKQKVAALESRLNDVARTTGKEDDDAGSQMRRLEEKLEVAKTGLEKRIQEEVKAKSVSLQSLIGTSVSVLGAVMLVGGAVLYPIRSTLDELKKDLVPRAEVNLALRAIQSDIDRGVKERDDIRAGKGEKEAISSLKAEFMAGDANVKDTVRAEADRLDKRLDQSVMTWQRAMDDQRNQTADLRDKQVPREEFRAAINGLQSGLQQLQAQGTQAIIPPALQFGDPFNQQQKQQQR